MDRVAALREYRASTTDDVGDEEDWEGCEFHEPTDGVKEKLKFGHNGFRCFVCAYNCCYECIGVKVTRPKADLLAEQPKGRRAAHNKAPAQPAAPPATNQLYPSPAIKAVAEILRSPNAALLCPRCASKRVNDPGSTATDSPQLCKLLQVPAVPAKSADADVFAGSASMAGVTPSLEVARLEEAVSALQKRSESTERKLDQLLEAFSAPPPASVKSYAAAASASLPAALSSACPASSPAGPIPSLAGLLQSSVQATVRLVSADEKRACSVIIDQLPISSKGAEKSSVNEFFQDLGLSAKAREVCYLRGPPSADHPAKLLVTLSSEKEQLELTSNRLLPRLRSEGIMDKYGRVFICPDLSPEQRNRLFLLRRYRDHLNSAASLPSEDAWFVAGAKLVKKNQGSVDWKGRIVAFNEEHFDRFCTEFLNAN